MKNLKAPFLVIALLLNVFLLSAETSSHPPAPMARGANDAVVSTNDVNCGGIYPPCNEGAGLPIDENIVFLIIGGLALGFTVIYKNNIKKASI